MSDPLTNAVVQVGDGRGFVVETHDEERLIITASHCLPHLPTGLGLGYLEERTYRDLVGALGQPQSVWAECLYIDLISDLAVLGSPDNQVLPEEADAYEEFTAAAGAIGVGARAGETAAWLLGLDGEWFEAVINQPTPKELATMWIESSSQPIAAGMSGSPIVVSGRGAVGVVVSNGGTPQPYLARALPVWLAESLGGRGIRS